MPFVYFYGAECRGERFINWLLVRPRNLRAGARVGAGGISWARVGAGAGDWAQVGAGGRGWASEGSGGREWVRVGARGVVRDGLKAL